MLIYKNLTIGLLLAMSCIDSFLPNSHQAKLNITAMRKYFYAYSEKKKNLKIIPCE